MDELNKNIAFMAHYGGMLGKPGKMKFLGSVSGPVCRIPAPENLDRAVRLTVERDMSQIEARVYACLLGREDDPDAQELCRQEVKYHAARLNGNSEAMRECYEQMRTLAYKYECLIYADGSARLKEKAMRNYDYFHSQNREREVPGHQGWTMLQRDTTVRFDNKLTGVSLSVDRKDYDCDAQFKAECEQQLRKHST